MVVSRHISIWNYTLLAPFIDYICLRHHLTGFFLLFYFNLFTFLKKKRQVTPFEEFIGSTHQHWLKFSRFTKRWHHGAVIYYYSLICHWHCSNPSFVPLRLSSPTVVTPMMCCGWNWWVIWARCSSCHTTFVMRMPYARLLSIPTLLSTWLAVTLRHETSPLIR